MAFKVFKGRNHKKSEEVERDQFEIECSLKHGYVEIQKLAVNKTERA